MIKVILTHEVKDYATWKPMFDSDETRRAAAGIKTSGVYTAVTNPNMVTVITEFPNQEVLNGFMSDPKMEEALKAAGVVSKPEILVLNQM